MPMSHKGLMKLIEECGEVIQVAAKLQAYPSGEHPDGKGPLLERLEDELADVLAAIKFARERFPFDHTRLEQRMRAKYWMFTDWYNEVSS
jgi:MazG nucleotide pyrophosphohydrolase domain